MPQPPVVVRQIVWEELFPWLILLRTVRIALAPSLVAAATLAVLLTPVGWRASGWLLGEAAEEAAPNTGRPQASRTAAPSATPRPARPPLEPLPPAARSQLARAIPLAPRAYLPAAHSPMLDAYTGLTEPLWRLLTRPISFREALAWISGFLWTLAVWSLPGGLITRRASVQLATGQVPGLAALARLVAARWSGYFFAPLYPLAGVLALALPVAFLGLLVRWGGSAGLVLLAFTWPLVLLLGLGAAWLLAGLLLGWPLQWPAISAERDGDAFDAFSRSFSYLYGRPLHYFFYFVLATALGALLWAVVEAAVALIQHWCLWALALGCGEDPLARLEEALAWWRAGATPLGPAGRPADVQPPGGALWLASGVVAALAQLVRSAAVGLRFCYFFTAATAIYLLLRQDVDEKELDEIYEPS
jgi:hypothetical protein